MIDKKYNLKKKLEFQDNIYYETYISDLYTYDLI